MAETSLISWTDSTWNIINGCSIVSPGCKNCYAMRWGWRIAHHPNPKVREIRAGLTRKTKSGRIVWTGDVRMHTPWLHDPIRWRKPRNVFVCAHGDLFHEHVPVEWIQSVFGIMAVANWHKYQCLTKRPDRMQELLSSDWFWDKVRNYAVKHSCFKRTGSWSDSEAEWRAPNPLPQVCLGTSIEDQKRADERIPFLMNTPAAVRFISAEPLLAPVDITPWTACGSCGDNRHMTIDPDWSCGELHKNSLDWVIVGGESGPGSRPMHPDWAREIRDACADASIPFHFKQWGNWFPKQSPVDHLDKRGIIIRRDGKCHLRDLNDETATRAFDTDALIRELRRPDTAHMVEIGKKKAGRLLDGVEHNGMPSLRPTDIQP